MIRNHSWLIWIALLLQVVLLSLTFCGSSTFPVCHAAITATTEPHQMTKEDKSSPPTKTTTTSKTTTTTTTTCSDDNGGQGDNDGNGSCVVNNNKDDRNNDNNKKNTIDTTDNNNNNNAVVIDPFKMWVDNVGEQTKQFLQDNVFGKAEALFSSNVGLFPSNNENNEKGENTNNEDHNNNNNNNNPFKDLFDQLSSSLDMMGITSSSSSSVGSSSNKDQPNSNHPPNKMNSTKDDGGDVVYKLLEHARLLGQDDMENGGGSAPHEVVKILGDAFLAVLDQLKETFGNVVVDGLDGFITVSLLYFLGDEDQRKNPTWKRQQHRFYEEIPKKELLVLHDALYLAQLTYVDTVQEFQTGLEQFQNDTWELVYGTTESLPHLPAHFLVIHKQLAPLTMTTTTTTTDPTLMDVALQSLLPWQSRNNNNKNDDEIQMSLIVRGTKHFADALADGLLKPTPYRGGYAHDGILTTGKALVDKHLVKLKELLFVSNRKRITMYVVGHSLGAGAGAIAAMELNDHDFITAKAIGFGCPSILSKELSLSTKDYIRTVVADADVVPRLSGASIVNVLMDLMEFDWGGPLLEDVALSLNRAKQILPTALSAILPPPELTLKWLNDYLDANVRPQLLNKTQHPQPRLESVLIPPGTCVHFYRDGVGYTGAVTPCDFFSSIDISRTLIDDHLVVPGYHRALLTLMRDWEQNFNVRKKRKSLGLLETHFTNFLLGWVGLETGVPFFVVVLHLLSSNRHSDVFLSSFWQFDFPHDVASIPV
jgi:hypothetical protein